MKVSVVGLGKLGAPIAAVMASRGHTVVGVDTNVRTVRAVNEARAPVAEPALQELISENRTRLSATTDLGGAVAATEVTFIIVPTPSEADGSYSLRHVIPVAEGIGHALRHKPGFHLVVLSSTVTPGSTAGYVLPILEQASGKQCGRDFGLCYNPEFVALGTVIRDILAPDLILIGESDERSGEELARFHRGLCGNRGSVARMNFVNAELTKLSVNTFITTKISYANMLAQVCERLPGADAAVVCAALGRDSRIGPKCLKGALGYGGPCFPRDNRAFIHLARRAGLEALLAEATDHLNDLQAPRVADLVLAHLPEGGAAGVLGLSYKPDSDVIEASQGMAVAQELLDRGVPVVVYDPAALEKARSEFAGQVTFARSASECIRRANVVVVATPWEEFARISPSDFNYSQGLPVLVDCWRMLDRAKFAPVLTYLTLGLGTPSAASGCPLFHAAGAGAGVDEPAANQEVV